MDGSLDDFSHTQSTPENNTIISSEESLVKLKASVIGDQRPNRRMDLYGRLVHSCFDDLRLIIATG